MIDGTIPSTVPGGFAFILRLPKADHAAVRERYVPVVNSDSFMGWAPGSLCVADYGIDEDCTMLSFTRFDSWSEANRAKFRPAKFRDLFAGAALV